MGVRGGEGGLLLLRIRDGFQTAAGLSIQLLSHTPTVCRTKGHDRQRLREAAVDRVSKEPKEHLTHLLGAKA